MALRTLCFDVLSIIPLKTNESETVSGYHNSFYFIQYFFKFMLMKSLVCLNSVAVESSSVIKSIPKLADCILFREEK